MSPYYLILSITVLYFIFAFSKNWIKKTFKIAPCSICAAVSVTWICAFAFYLLGGKIDLTIITLLIGESIGGLMYKAEGWFKKFDLQKFWLMRLIIIVGGTATMYSFLTRQFEITMISAVASIILMIIVFVLQKPKNTPKSTNKINDILDNCC
ncbi:MAG: hypothetical protein WCT36_01695 [Candidatus Gracilibacteria bacterium]